MKKLCGIRDSLEKLKERECGIRTPPTRPSLAHFKILGSLRALVNEDTLLRTHCCPWAAQTGKHLLRTKNVSEQNQKQFLPVPDTKFVSATNVARAGKRGNICVGKNVSATMCPRLPGP